MKHKKWKETWFSEDRKYPPITDVNDFECIREITDWSETVKDFIVPSHTYVLNGGSNLCGFFPLNDYTNWVEFKVPIAFLKSRRKFEKVHVK
tara:strand:+ start:1010 stop:1285 length:276 start_codon:yes stop_codon:yes gene_type:complete